MNAFDLRPDASLLLVVDWQERFLGAIPGMAEDRAAGRAARTLVAGAQLLAVATIFSEQYPKGLGPTQTFLRAAAPVAPVHAKTHFSCLEDPLLASAIDRLPAGPAVLCGVEAHVCVLATAADLLARGRPVVVAADAVDSRDPANRELALAALRQLGALVLPVESILFRWQRQAGVGAFKAISALVR